MMEIPTARDLNLAESDAAHVRAWAEKHAPHRNDNPSCYSGTCGCAGGLAYDVAGLVRILRHRGTPYPPRPKA